MIQGAILGLALALNIDFGGDILSRMQTFEMLERTNVTVPLSGVCLSACTMFLGLSKVCVEPGSMFGFHSAYVMNGDKPQLSRFGNSVMMQYYPESIKKWIAETGALKSLELTLMTANEAYKLGIPKCEDKKKN